MKKITLSFFLLLSHIICVSQQIENSKNFRLIIKFRDNINITLGKHFVVKSRKIPPFDAIEPLFKKPVIFNLKLGYPQNIQKIIDLFLNESIVDAEAITENDVVLLDKVLSNISDCHKSSSFVGQCAKDSTMVLLTNLFSLNPIIVDSLIAKKKCYSKIGNIMNYFSVCHCDSLCLVEAKQALAKIPSIQSVEIESVTMSAAPKFQKDFVCDTSITPYWNILNFQSLWSRPGGLGENGGLIIVESGGTPMNNCKYDSTLKVLGPKGDAIHATNVFGILKSKHSKCTTTEPDCLGIVPNAEIKGHIAINQSCPFVLSDTIPENNQYDVLLYAVILAKAGDVILIEFSTGTNFPIETIKPVADIISVANCLGISVVEPVGNAGQIIENRVISAMKGLIVGATHTPHIHNGTLHSHVLGKNCSNRSVNNCDCLNLSVFSSNYANDIIYQLGENLLTTSPNNKFCTFGATSGASAIVAGMVTSIQSIFRSSMRNNLLYIEPDTIKKWLLRSGNIPVYYCKKLRSNNKNKNSRSLVGHIPNTELILRKLDLFTTRKKRELGLTF